MNETTAAIKPRILIISTSGLARFVAALGAMGAIRAHHHDANIVLLTARATSAFAATAPYFDDVWTDDSDGVLHLPKLWSLRKRLRALTEAQPFDRVYDLDGTAHSRRIFWALYGHGAFALNRKDIPWSGVMRGTAFAYEDPRREAMHLVDRWAAQLKIAGIGAVLRPDLSWVARQVTSFAVPFRMTEPFVIIAPSPGPGDPWPAERYGELARGLAATRQTPVLLGQDVAAELCREVMDQCPTAVDLTGKATVNEMVFLSWAATAAIGPDNGILHLAAAAGCRTVVLYNSASDPALVGQRGAKVQVLRRPYLSDIPVGEVLAAFSKT
jgi:ADP-heptose:LPS heptosyltransferase